MTEPEKTATIEYSHFVQVDIRVGKVLSAERVPKSAKLLKLSVDLGEEQPRQILAGVGLTFEPEAMVGGSFAFVANLAPRKMMGLESHGMILATGPSEDKLALVTATRPGHDGLDGDAAPGSRLS